MFKTSNASFVVRMLGVIIIVKVTNRKPSSHSQVALRTFEDKNHKILSSCFVESTQ